MLYTYTLIYSTSQSLSSFVLVGDHRKQPSGVQRPFKGLFHVTNSNSSVVLMKENKKDKRQSAYCSSDRQTMVKNGLPKCPTVIDKHAPPKPPLRHLVVDSPLLEVSSLFHLFPPCNQEPHGLGRPLNCSPCTYTHMVPRILTLLPSQPHHDKREK
jgi:hypothetical protein